MGQDMTDDEISPLYGTAQQINAQERFAVHLFAGFLLCYFQFLAIYEQLMAIGFNM